MSIKVRMALSQGSITFLFFFGFVLGVAIAAVALLGSQIPLKCFDAGNAADWVAAFGTWAIGIGAIRFSASELKLKVHERREKRYGEVLAELNKYGELAYRAQLMETNLDAFVRQVERYISTTSPLIVSANELIPLKEHLKEFKAHKHGANLAGESALLMARATVHANGLIEVIESLERQGAFANIASSFMSRVLQKSASAMQKVLADVPAAIARDTEGPRGLARSLESRIGAEDAKLMES
ncbi:hypothetical protein I5U85_00295 [Stenotrophomonas maltophilia]|nr:hypothetical protein [Stenotrophomonas maltophilia]